MPIWVESDAYPKVIKKNLFRAVEQPAFQVTLAANHLMYLFRQIFY